MRTDGAAVNIEGYNRAEPRLYYMVAIGDPVVHALCTAHIIESCCTLADHALLYCNTFNHSAVKLLRFYLKNRAVTK